MTQDGKDPSRGEMRFRTAAAADRPRLIELINAAFSLEEFFEGTRTDEERLAAMMAKGRILVAEDGAGRIAASIYTEDRGKHGYLGMLAVDPGRQRQGLGHRQMEVAEEGFRQQGCEAVEIVVLSLRPELLPVYQRFGYAITGTEEFKTTRPLKAGVECHCITMSKRL